MTILERIAEIDKTMREIDAMGKRLAKHIHSDCKTVATQNKSFYLLEDAPWPWTDEDGRKLAEAALSERPLFDQLRKTIDGQWRELLPRLKAAVGNIQNDFPMEERGVANSVLDIHGSLERTVNRMLPRCEKALDAMADGRKAGFGDVMQWQRNPIPEHARKALERLALAATARPAGSAGPEDGKTGRKPRVTKRGRYAKVELTARQTEAYEQLALRKTKSGAARAMGISRAAFDKLLNAANRKLGKLAVKHRPRTGQYPLDRRGQANLSHNHCND